MSTKPIREALEYLRDIPDLTGTCRMYADHGLIQVEAIEKAAREWVRVGGDFNMDEEEPFNDLMESIAKEAP